MPSTSDLQEKKAVIPPSYGWKGALLMGLTITGWLGSKRLWDNGLEAAPELVGLPPPLKDPLSLSEKFGMDEQPHSLARHLLSAPVAINPIPEQRLEVGKPYQFKVHAQDVFSGNVFMLGATQADGTALPDWLNFGPALLGNYSIGSSYFTSSGIFVVNNTAFISYAAYRLQILDVTNLTNPRALGGYDMPGSTINDITVIGNIAYLATTGSPTSGLQILDVSNLTNPRLLGSYNNVSGMAVTIVGQTAYLAANDQGLQVLDVSNLSEPVLSGKYTTPGWYAAAVAVVGNFAYLANNYDLQIINVSNPSNLTLLSSHAPGCRDVKVVNNIAFLGGLFSLQILNVTNPTAAVLLGNFGNLNSAREITIIGNIAFVAEGINGIEMLDITIPSNPILLGRYTAVGPNGGAQQIKIANNIAFVADRELGLQILALSEGVFSGAPTLSSVGKFSCLLQARNILGETVSTPVDFVINQLPQRIQTVLTDQQIFPGENFAFYIDTSNLFRDPDGAWLQLSAQQLSGAPLPDWLTFRLTPKLTGTYATPGTTAAVVVSGKTAFVANWDFGLQILDISTLSNPVSLSYYHTPLSARSVSIVGNTVFVSDYSSLQIINVTDLLNPTLLRNYTRPMNCVKTTVIGNTVFVANEQSGLAILNVSDLTNPILLDSYNSSEARDVEVVGNTAFVAAYNSGLKIFDVTDPSKIKLLSTYVTQYYPWDVSIVGEIAFVAAYDTILQIVNVANLSDPTFLGSYKTSGTIRSVKVVSDTAFLAVSSFLFVSSPGLKIINVADPTQPVLLGEYDTLGDTLDVTIVGSTAFVADGPAGLQILDIDQWTLSGTPTLADAGNYPIRISATDSLGGTVSGSFVIKVQGPPVVNTPLALQYAQVNTLFNLFIPAGLFTDPNFDPMVLTASSENGNPLPAWLSFSGTTGKFTGIPKDVDRGTISLQISANDGYSTITSTNFSLVINTPPYVASPLRDQVAPIERYFNYSAPLTFIDADGDSLVYQARLKTGAPLPPWLTFIPGTCSFFGTPRATDVTQLEVTLLADDNHGGTATDAFILKVKAPLQAGDPISTQTIYIGANINIVLPYTFFRDSSWQDLFINATMANGDPLPNWLVFDTINHRFTGIAPYSSKGTFALTIAATDVTGASANQSMIIQIPNQAPVKDNEIPLQESYIWRALEVVIPPNTFRDPDSDPLSYDVFLEGKQALPNWLRFDPIMRKFSGTPPLLPWPGSSLTLEVFVSDGIATTSARLRMNINSNTVIEDIIKYYSFSGAGLVILDFIARALRHMMMKKVRTALASVLPRLIPQENIAPTLDTQENKEDKNLSKKNLQAQATILLMTVQKRDVEASTLTEQIATYINLAYIYANPSKTEKRSLLNVGNIWGILKGIIEALESSLLQKKMMVSEIQPWAEALHQLLKLLVENEVDQGRTVLSTDKDVLLRTIRRITKHVNIQDPEHIAIRQYLALAQEALICLDSSNAIEDLVKYRDRTILIEIIKTMLLPPYGLTQVFWHIINIPGGWYPQLIILDRLADRVLEKETEVRTTALQSHIATQADWSVIYEGVKRLGEVGDAMQDKSLRQQLLESTDKAKPGLRYYSQFHSFWWQRCTGPGCENRANWIRQRAEQEIERFEPTLVAEDDPISVEPALSLTKKPTKRALSLLFIAPPSSDTAPPSNLAADNDSSSPNVSVSVSNGG